MRQTMFKPPDPDWGCAVLTYDGFEEPEPMVELRAWYATTPNSSDPDFVAMISLDGCIQVKSSTSAPVVQRTSVCERELLFMAGMAIGDLRLRAKVEDALASVRACRTWLVAGRERR